ncbi:DHA2 family efflux MFS transporter permease subunit [Pediococcus argentinicus]|uniref:DHA2 family efflux MFS transporter permease subunit n=1 Tax=Pediococcus argentinicus TaxID=480391 RepID=UPI00338E9929
MEMKKMRQVALILAFGLLAPMLDTTMTNIAINDISRDLGSSLNSVQWILTAYVLATSVAVPFSGWLSQRFNGKYVFLSAQLVFGAASIWSALSTDVNSLIFARVVQGFSAGLIIPLVTTILMSMGSRKVVNDLMMIVMLPIMVGPIFGPIIGALIVQYGNWNWIFWINVPIVLIVSGLILWKIPDLPGTNVKAKIDWLGILLLGAGSTSLIYGISRAGREATFNNSDTIIYSLVGIALLLVYAAWGAFKKGTAVLPLGLFKSPVYSATIFNLILAGIITNGPMLILPLYFQQGRGFSILATGLWMLPQGLGMLLIRPILLKLMNQLGTRYVVLISLSLTLLGTVPLMFVTKSTSMWLISAILFARGLGVGGVIMPMMTSILVGMKKELIAQANIGARIFQNMGGAFGSALVATVVASYLQNHHYLTANIVSYQHAFGWAVAITVLMILPAMLLPKTVD